MGFGPMFEMWRYWLVILHKVLVKAAASAGGPPGGGSLLAATLHFLIGPHEYCSKIKTGDVVLLECQLKLWTISPSKQENSAHEDKNRSRCYQVMLKSMKLMPDAGVSSQMFASYFINVKGKHKAVDVADKGHVKKSGMLQMEEKYNMLHQKEPHKDSPKPIKIVVEWSCISKGSPSSQSNMNFACDLNEDIIMKVLDKMAISDVTSTSCTTWRLHKVGKSVILRCFRRLLESFVQSEGLGFSSCAAPLPRGVRRCPEVLDDVQILIVQCAGIPVDIREQVIRLIRTMAELERKQWRTTKGRGRGDKSIGIDPKTSGGRRENNSSQMEGRMSRV
ncbi:uncharacterized protein EDB93DRAFT_1103805 [Suillus bovinus]|uniref:uncharacterized protein n=1 Tax=Suillus bovinus TaxID=48563 RepID=UPI001B886960|nr:uncharacterized protein EDB93DRAFT_1103805 [Suillus bovinus]KAG2148136.1 hypothetical protein EDB93DRAFT_1103805 [Suillus bovinus]